MSGAPPVTLSAMMQPDTTTSEDTTSAHWVRNLAVIWLAQFVTLMGFSFVFPFVPLFVQELGITDPAQAALWAGISSTAQGLTMFLASPIWGMIGDRYGRKLNVLRAMIGGGILTGLSGLVGNVYQLTALRLLTGLASGSVAPTMALAASSAPKHRIAFTIGAVQSALFLGTTVGPLFGGFLADTVGYRATFMIAGAVVIAAALLLLVFVQENFQRPVEPKPIFARQAFTDLFSLITSKDLAPLLGTMFIVQIAPMMMFTILPVLLVSFVQGSVATTTGVAFAILGLTASVAAYVTGWLSSRMSLTKMLVAACVGAGIFYLPLTFVNSVLPLYLFLGIGGLFQGILSSSTNGLVGLMLPPEKQATGFGATQSTFALAIAIGPLLGAGIATVGGLRAVFPFQAAALLATAAIVVWLLAGRDNSPQPSARSAKESS